MITESQFELRLARKLRSAGIRFLINPTIRGLRPDFVTEAKDGRRVVVETKSWRHPSNTAIRIAIKQAQYYKMAAKADESFVVIEGLKRSRPSDGVLTEDDLIRDLTRVGERRETPGDVIAVLLNYLREPTTTPTTKAGRKQRTVFASMPFKETYVDTYFNAIVGAAKSVGALADRADYDEYSGDIVRHIQKQIKDSVAIVADLSESRPNVLYEIGYAEAINRKVVQISSSPLGELPFNVRNNNTIQYSIGNTHKLRRRLRARLKKVPNHRS